MNLSIDVIAGIAFLILFVVWLVRLEGRVNGKADTASVANANEKIALADQKLGALEAAAKVHEDTKGEVIRLQEQIKHLTALVEGWLRDQAAPRAPRNRQGAPD